MRTRSLVLVALAATLFGSLALAGSWGRGTGAGRQGGLELNTEQSEKLQAITAACEADTAPLREQLHAKMQELGTLWASQELDSGAVTTKQGEIRALQERMQARNLERETERRAVLTSEQRTKLAQLGPGPGRGCGDGPRCGGPECGGGGWWGGAEGRGRCGNRRQ
jgi:Spy/CpxP family protein refolding chaperone